MGCSADGREWIENLCQSGAHFLNWDYGITGMTGMTGIVGLWDDGDFGMTLGINIEVDFVITAGIEIKIILIYD